jgi:glutamate racemase
LNAKPVGIFDSGMGGLSVAREIRATLPAEPLVYLADTAYCPYGGRPLEQIRSRSLAAVAELVSRGCKAVVVACNTATGAALELLRAEFSVPIVGLEPAVKPAALASRNGRVGVMATSGTLQSERFRRLVESHARGAQVVPVPCPGLVELVEAGETDGERIVERLTTLLAPLRDAEVDTVVLGCTHYPFLRGAVAKVMGPEVQLLDSGRAVARQLERVLREGEAFAPHRPADIRMLTTGDPAGVAEVVGRLWGVALPVEWVTLREREPQPAQYLSSGAPPSTGSVR